MKHLILVLLTTYSAFSLSAQEVVFLENSDSVKITNLWILNSPYREANLSISPDGQQLFFMSLRGGQEWSSSYMVYNGDSVYDGDIWVSNRVDGHWQIPRALPHGINTFLGEDEPVISADGKRIYFQSWNIFWDSKGGPYYVAGLEGDSIGHPSGLGGGITDFFRTIQATDGMTISADEKTFVVAAGLSYDRDMDLFLSRKVLDGWTWCQRMDLSTDGDERSVFLAADGETLYFSSDGYDGFGGLDIYKTTLHSDGSFGEIINIGEPFNSPDDDYGFIISSDGSEAYFIKDGDIYTAELESANVRIKPGIE